MDKAEVDRWLQAYVEAWKSYDRDQIGELFAADVRYRYHPYDDPVVGRAAVVRSWLGEATDAGAPARDEQGTYDAAYRAVAVDGDVAVATGSSSYRSAPGGPMSGFPHRRLVASAAPSASAANLAHTTVGCTSGENVARDENPQSALAMTFSRPTSPAYWQMPSAMSSRCST